MNVGVDRTAIVDEVLIGKGEAASTPPIASVYGDAFDEAHSSGSTPTGRARSSTPPVGAREPMGFGAAAGARASFPPLLYNASDTLRRDLAVAFAASMKKIGGRGAHPRYELG